MRYSLSETEEKVLDSILNGKTNREIGERLHMALDTVKNMQTIFIKRKK